MKCIFVLTFGEKTTTTTRNKTYTYNEALSYTIKYTNTVQFWWQVIKWPSTSKTKNDIYIYISKRKYCLEYFLRLILFYSALRICKKKN